jgi:uncharacterized membrane protein YkoI
LLGGLALQPAFADADTDAPAEPQRERSPPRQNGHLSSNEAAKIAQKQQGGGRVLAVDLTEEGYRVKILQKGDVHIVVVPNQ